MVVFQNDALGQPHDGRDDATGRGQIGTALAVAHFVVAHLDDSPVYFAVESSAQTLGHVTEVHVLVVDFAQIGMGAEILVG